MIPIAVIPQLTENPLNSKNNHNHLAYEKYSRKKYIHYNLFKFEIHTVRTQHYIDRQTRIYINSWALEQIRKKNICPWPQAQAI